MLVPGVAGISIPLWNDEAYAVGELRLPKYELIDLLFGSGQKKSESEMISELKNCVCEIGNWLEFVEKSGVKNIITTIEKIIMK